MEQFIFETENRDRESSGDDIITMKGDEHFHLSRVMRLKVGDKVLATDGKGVTCLCTIQRIDKDHSTFKVVEEYRDLNSSRRRFCIAMSVLKPISKLEFAVEKCTELGAANFLLFHCERSEKVNLRPDRMAGIVKSAVDSRFGVEFLNWQSQRIWKMLHLEAMLMMRNLCYMKNLKT